MRRIFFLILLMLTSGFIFYYCTKSKPHTSPLQLEFIGHHDGAVGIVASRSLSRIVTVDQESVVKIWNTESKSFISCVSTTGMPARMLSLNFSEYIYILGSGSSLVDAHCNCQQLGGIAASMSLADVCWNDSVLFYGPRDTVYIYDNATNTSSVVAAIATLALPMTIACDKRQEGFFVGYDDGTVYHSKTNSILKIFEAEESVVAIAFDTVMDVAYIGSSKGRMFIINKHSGHINERLSVSRSVILKILPALDGSAVCVIASGRKIVILSSSTYKQIGQTEILNSPIVNACLASDGGICILLMSGDIFACRFP